MKIAILYNTSHDQVYQLRGPVSQERYPENNVRRIVEGLELNGHEVAWLAADRTLVDRLEGFFGKRRDGEWPGLVFNLAFGIQGELRYCHVPGMLEMLGFPYLGSGPLGHALATDKAIAKAIFLHHRLPTPLFKLARTTDVSDPGLGYPLIVKPVQGASSLGLQLVYDEASLRHAIRDSLSRFGEPVLLEQYVGGREFNVSILGNDPPQVLPVVEVVLGQGGLPVYSLEDKQGRGGRTLDLGCPAAMPEAIYTQAQDLALKAFTALSCRDWARVELRLDDAGRLQLLEINTIPGLGSIASFPVAARQAGIDAFPDLLQCLVDVAVQRYQNTGKQVGTR